MNNYKILKLLNFKQNFIVPYIVLDIFKKLISVKFKAF